MTKLELRDVRKIYSNEIVAVSNFNLKVEEKEFIVLVGPSGSGKSTVLRMIAGLEDVTKGEIYLDDALINDLPSKDRDMAMIFQNYAIYPHMNVFDNIAFGLKIRKIPKDEIQKKVLEAAEVLNIEHLLYRKPKTLSGGEKQRVAIGRAIVRNPSIFLMDEPLSNLDAALRIQMRSNISKLYQKLDSTFIYVTHDQMEAMTLGTRIVVMKDGVIQQVDTPKNLYENPKNVFVAQFITYPSMNILSGNLKAKDRKVYFIFDGNEIEIPKITGNILVKNRRIDDEILLGIRSEDFYIDFKEEGFEGIVSLIENQGTQTHMHVRLGSKDVIISANKNLNVKLNQIIKFHVNTNNLYFFDKKTEHRIITTIF